MAPEPRNPATSPTPPVTRRPSPAAVTPADIQAAAHHLTAIVRETALETSPRLSSAVQQPVYLKREDLQVGRSYKVRGAHNFISSLTAEQRARGIVCASAGNHAQGVAFACRQLQIHGKVYLPATTPRQKRARIQDIGGRWVEQVITGAVFDETSAAAQEFAAESGAVYVPPFDHPRIVAGQGTVAWEITHQLTEPIDTVLVPVGGGGLVAGVAVWLRHLYPDVHIVGVEPAGAASLQAALAAGRPVELAKVDGFVDGAAVRRVGDVPFAVARDLVDEVVAVPEGAVCSEMLDLYQVEGIIAEPAGALASAALRGYLPRAPQGPVVCIVSGGNNDVSRYADILERSLVHEGLRHYFLVTFPQQPGALRHFLEDVLGPDDDIVLFEYVKKNNRETGPALVGVDLARADALPSLLANMEASPLQIDKLAPDSPVFEFLL